MYLAICDTAKNWIICIKSHSKTLVAVLFALIFIAILALNLMQPTFTDDWEYAFIYRLFGYQNKDITPDTRIGCIWDIFTSQYSHYFSWGGRNVNHFIAQFLLYIGTPLNKIINSLAYVFFIYIMCKFTKKKDAPIRFSSVLLINILLFFSLPAFGSTVLWITGSANYLWGTLILLLFLLPYKNFYECGKMQSKTSTLKSIYLFVGGIIAGWTNENMAATAIFVLLVFFFYLRKKRLHIPLWFYTGLLGAIIGFCIMVAAPGNYIRYQTAIAEKGAENISKITLLFDQFVAAISGVFFYLSPIIILYIAILIVYKHLGRKNHQTTVLSFVFFASAAIATLLMTSAPVFPERAWFGIITLLIIAIVIVYNQLDFDNTLIDQLRTSMIFLCTIVMLGYYISGYKDLSRANAVFSKRAHYINQQKKEGVMDFVFRHEIKTKSRVNNLYDLTDDPNYWTNCFYARYHGVNSVVIVKEENK